MKHIKYLVYFGIQQALSCIFPASIFIILAVSKLVHIPYLYRYDFILIACLIVQLLMVYFKLETIDELKVICLFHILGLCLEVYKVHMGSWAYPEYAFTKIGEVPLYSGFMYASVASYICQSWKRLELKFLNWPSKYIMYPIAIIIYLNFFTHHFMFDMRWVITAGLVLVLWKSVVEFKVSTKQYRMPLILSFLFIGFFIWVAENISTYFGAWKYPDQIKIWNMVHISKISSWFLLVIISIIIVVNLKNTKYLRCK
ncbi:MAG: hypothetical protein A2Y24_06105 [Clostridiales bacterium GWE2_32_10]|nr:MAG: hypothetical protein A2Y24_06105 [Clostridiales bacterium GWE2_32_10]